MTHLAGTPVGDPRRVRAASRSSLCGISSGRGQDYRVLAFRGFVIAGAAAARGRDGRPPRPQDDHAMRSRNGGRMRLPSSAPSAARASQRCSARIRSCATGRRSSEVIARGDDQVLRGAVMLLEERGHRVVGAHELAPEPCRARSPDGNVAAADEDRAAIARGARRARRALGLRHRAGGGRGGEHVLAVEGPEGTDRMLRRVRRQRQSLFGLRGRREGGVVWSRPPSAGRICGSTCRPSVLEPSSRRPAPAFRALRSAPARPWCSTRTKTLRAGRPPRRFPRRRRPALDGQAHGDGAADDLDRGRRGIRRSARRQADAGAEGAGSGRAPALRRRRREGDGGGGPRAACSRWRTSRSWVSRPSSRACRRSSSAFAHDRRCRGRRRGPTCSSSSTAPTLPTASPRPCRKRAPDIPDRRLCQPDGLGLASGPRAEDARLCGSRSGAAALRAGGASAPWRPADDLCRPSADRAARRDSAGARASAGAAEASRTQARSSCPAAADPR